MRVFIIFAKIIVCNKKHMNMNNLLIFNIGAWEVVLIVLAILLLFGGKKIPELMKGLGKGVKSFKEGMNEIEKDIKEDDKNQ